MKTQYLSYSFLWRNIHITIRYTASYVTMTDLAHLEILVQNRQPIPITNTGYRSHFCNPVEIDDYGGPIPYVQARLEAEVTQARRKEKERELSELRLFDI